MIELYFLDGKIVELLNNIDNLKYVEDKYSKLLLGSVIDMELPCSS